MKKKLLIIFFILLVGLIFTIILDCVNLNVSDISLTLKTSQLNIIDSKSLDIIENIESEQVNDFINDTSVDIANIDSSSTKTTSNETNVNNSNEKFTTQNTTTVKTSTKDESKSNTKVTKNNTTTETNKTKQETPNQTTNNQTKPKEEEIINTPTDNSRPELANSTYRVTNTAIVPEIIKILNDEISKSADLVSYGSKAVVGNKSSAYAKTTGFTYLFVSDISKGKIAGNYASFPQRVRNNVGAFGNYNVYAEDEYTYDGRGLNPKWCQTLVWIYITF